MRNERKSKSIDSQNYNKEKVVEIFSINRSPIGDADDSTLKTEVGKTNASFNLQNNSMD